MLELLKLRAPGAALIHEPSGGRPVVLGARQLPVGRPAAHAAAGRGADPGTFVICDGEIFNAEEIRTFVRGAGRNPGPDDVELLAHLYELEGPSGFKRLDGQFALALWDGRRNTLVLGRDPLGVRSIYYRATA